MSDISEAGGTSQQVVQRAGQGFPIFGILTIIFVVGKILGYLAWSWVWVLAPLWIPYAVFAALMLLIGVFAFGVALIGALTGKR